MPGANERALEKAKAIPADALILDLEDAVAPDAKPEARERVCAAATSGDYGSRELAIRANGIGTPWHDDDLRATLPPAHAVVVPKVDSAAEVHTSRRRSRPRAPPTTPRSGRCRDAGRHAHAEEIAGASERLTVLVMGTNDLAKELQAATSPAAIHAHRARLCLLARSGPGKVILDGVYNDIKDEAGFLPSAQGARWASTARR